MSGLVAPDVDLIFSVKDTAVSLLLSLGVLPFSPSENLVDVLPLAADSASLASSSCALLLGVLVAKSCSLRLLVKASSACKSQSPLYVGSRRMRRPCWLKASSERPSVVVTVVADPSVVSVVVASLFSAVDTLSSS